MRIIAFQSRTETTAPRITLIVDGERTDIPENEIPTAVHIKMFLEEGVDLIGFKEIIQAIMPIRNSIGGKFSLETEDMNSILIGAALMAMDLQDRESMMKLMLEGIRQRNN